MDPRTTSETHPQSALSFGDWTLDPAARELRRNGQEVTVPPKLLACLLYLIEQRERAVSRDELIQAVWGHTHLSDGVLAQSIFQLRRILGDGDSTHYIKSIRGYGYRWIAEPGDHRDAEKPISPEVEPSAEPVEFSRPDSDNLQVPIMQAPRPSRLGWRGSLVMLTLALVVGLAWWGLQPRGIAGESASALGAGLALVLPVDADQGPGRAWIRLGIMDMVAARLRESGLPVVPSDTVIHLMRGRDAESANDTLARLVDATGSRWIVSVRARQADTLWSVTLEARTSAGTVQRAHAQSADLLAAAGLASDRLSTGLGLMPAAEAQERHDLRMLVLQVEAALLEQRLEEASALIDQADPELREHPEIKYRSGRIAFHRLELEQARELFQGLLDAPGIKAHGRLHARTLGSLASVHAMLGDLTSARPLLEACASRYENRYPEHAGIARMNLGLLFQEQGDAATARAHFAEAQRLLHGVGDIQRQSVLSSNLGVHEIRSDRPAEALEHLGRARKGFVAVQNTAGELHVIAAMVEAHLDMLDLPAARALEPRLLELQSQVRQPLALAYAGLMRVELMQASGMLQAASDALGQARALIADRPGLESYRAGLDMIDIRARLDRSGPDQALHAAAQELTDAFAAHANLAGYRARAWLLQSRIAYGLGLQSDASVQVAEFAKWANESGFESPRLYATLAEVERAAADTDAEALAGACRRAFQLADASHAPVRLLHVAQACVPRLLDDPESRAAALLMTHRVGAWAPRHFDAAEVQLRAYQRVGPESSWRAALDSAMALAGERELPDALKVAPGSAMAAHED